VQRAAPNDNALLQEMRKSVKEVDVLICKETGKQYVGSAKGRCSTFALAIHYPLKALTFLWMRPNIAADGSTQTQCRKLKAR
jgi:hypothetical protein